MPPNVRCCAPWPGRSPGEFYDGGRPGRDAAIEAGAGASAAELVARVTAVVDRMEGLLDLLDSDHLRLPTAYADGLPVEALVLAWWREFSIHLTDLDLGAEHTLWGPQLREHLVGFLAPRVPVGLQLALEPTDVDEPRRIGQGSLVRLRGTANDLVAWLAGREPLGQRRGVRRRRRARRPSGARPVAEARHPRRWPTVTGG